MDEKSRASHANVSAGVRASEDGEAITTPPELRSSAKSALPHTALSRRLDSISSSVGGLTSWIWLLLLAVIVLNVVLRYVFGSGRIEFEEAQWHLYSIGFLAGLAYCATTDTHIRVDVLRDRLTPRRQSWIELYGILLLLLPFIALMLFASLPFVADSYVLGEVSPSPGGLPLRWLIKAALPLGFVLLALATLSRLLRVSAHLFGAPAALHEPATNEPEEH